MGKLLPLGKPITLEEALARAKEDNHTHDHLQAHYAEVVAEVEAEVGPQVPPLILKRGRPRKGEFSADLQVRALKMPAAFWTSFQAQAEAAGLSMHAAMRSALMEWAAHHKGH